MFTGINSIRCGEDRIVVKRLKEEINIDEAQSAFGTGRRYIYRLS
mgnify:CR=1 FL=1